MIRMQTVALPAILAGLVVLSGCAARVGSVSGKVTTSNGTALPTGTVTFLGANNDVMTSPIASDGSYSIPKVSVGLAKVTVSVPVTPAIPGGMKMDPAKMKGGADPTGGTGTPPTAPPVRAIKISPHYQNPDTSKLTFDVKPGSQTYDIKLD